MNAEEVGDLGREDDKRDPARKAHSNRIGDELNNIA